MTSQLNYLIINQLTTNNIIFFQVKKVALGDDPPFSTIVDYYFNKAAPFAEEAIKAQTVRTRMPAEIKNRLISVRGSISSLVTRQFLCCKN